MNMVSPIHRVNEQLFLEEHGDIETVPLGDARWLGVSLGHAAERRHAHRIELKRSGDGETIARALVLPAKDASPLRDAGFRAGALDRTALVANVSVREGEGDLLPFLLYAAGRRARILGASTLLVGLPDLNGPEGRLLGLTGVPRTAPPGFLFGAQRMDRWMFRTYEASRTQKIDVSKQLFADEVAESIQRWVATAPTWTFFGALREHRLAREQYVYVISNLYQFVRHTTRLIGRAISNCADPELRRHWIKHLNGEVNHEVIIERDLAHLGEDVAFVMKHMAPSAAAQEFMAVQESVVAYHNDPVLFMASPLAAEAFTAFLDQRFIDDLHACVAKWGVETPKQATQFLTSHVNTDGGEDGHWRMSIDALPRLLRDETHLNLLLTTNASSRRAVERIWSTCIDDMAVWSGA
jgi:pyrroloquinoline quinone (PQQ) biosynthesis protein C